MSPKVPSPQTRLYALAERQQGFFSARQAESAGFDRRNHTYHLSRGHWVREARGLYRLSHFPRTPEADLCLWSLWSRGPLGATTPPGIISHESALALHKLSDLLPDKIHLTVPRTFGTRTVPAVLELHRAELPEPNPDEIEERPGFRLTTPLRTLLDLAQAQTLSPDLLVQGLLQALDRGLVTQAQIEKHAPLRELLPSLSQQRSAEPLYRLIRAFIRPPEEPPPPAFERDLRASARLLQSGMETLGRWLRPAESRATSTHR